MKSPLLVAIASLFALAWPGTQASNSSEHKTQSVYSVQAPIRELPRGFLAWLHRHPEAMPGADKQGSAEERPSYEIRWPYLDLYSPEGISVYHADDGPANVKAIQAMPRSLPAFTHEKAIRPTLDEIEAMFPEIGKSGVPAPSRGEYTVFVINNPERPACLAQDLAIQELKKRVAGTSVRIVEVRLKAEEE